MRDSKVLQEKIITVVIPALNEELLIAKVIKNIPQFVDHIVVIDDGSTDNTVEVSESLGAIVVSHKRNRGVGVAFHTGLEKALELKSDIMVNIDADAQFNPLDIPKLIEPIIQGEADFVTASRFINKEFYPKMTKVKFYGNKMMSFLISTLTKKKFYDVSCGFRAYSKNVLLSLNLQGDFTYTQESFLNLAFSDFIIKEIPIKIKGTREIGESRIASNIFRYAKETFKIILRTFRDYEPFKLFLYFSVPNFIMGAGLGIFLMVHYILAGQFSPHKWAGFLSGFFILIALVLVGLGFVLDMFVRIRKNQEKILKLQKRIFYFK